MNEYPYAPPPAPVFPPPQQQQQQQWDAVPPFYGPVPAPAAAPPPPNRNRLVLAVIALAVVVLALGGYLIADTAGAFRTTTAERIEDAGLPAAPERAVAPVEDDEEVEGAVLTRTDYLSYLRAQGIIPLYGDETDALELADATCEALDNGLSTRTAIEMAESNGFMPTDAEIFVDAIVAYRCPEYL